MPWTPSIAATDVRAIVSNLVAYLDANQADALAWASPGRELADLTIYDSAEVRIKADFPHMGLVRRRVTTDETDAGLVITCDLTWETEVSTTFANEAARTAAVTQLRKDVDNYGYAVESMLLNVPRATLLANVRDSSGLHVSVTSQDPLEVALSETEAMFNAQLQHRIRLVQPLYLA